MVRSLERVVVSKGLFSVDNLNEHFQSRTTSRTLLATSVLVMQPNRTQPSTPVASVAVEASPVGSPAPGTPAARPTFMQRLSWFGGKVLDVAESIGEGVVSILGKIHIVIYRFLFVGW